MASKLSNPFLQYEFASTLERRSQFRLFKKTIKYIFKKIIFVDFHKKLWKIHSNHMMLEHIRQQNEINQIFRF